MAKKSRKPALYELLKSNRAGPERVTPPEFPEDSPSVDEDDLEVRPAWFTPGRSIHVPVGYIFAGLAVGIGLIVGAYIVGYQRGETVGKQVTEEMFAAGGEARSAADQGFADDPLAGSGDGPAGTSRERAGSSSGGGSELAGSETRRADEHSGWGPIESDPRETGKYYFRLMETRKEGAQRLAQFCRDNGLEAYMVRANNGNLWRVFVLPGFTAEERDEGADAALRDKIRRVGNSWKLQGGARNLGDAYPVKYTGG